MKVSSVALVLIIFLACLMITPVMADTTVIGDFTSVGQYQDNKSLLDQGGIVGGKNINAVYFKDIGSVGRIQTILYMGYADSTMVFNRDVGDWQSGQAPFTSDLGTGLIGWNEVYDYDGDFLFEYWYIQYTTFSNIGYTGNVWDNLTYNATLLHGFMPFIYYGVSNLGSSYGAYAGNYDSNPNAAVVIPAYPNAGQYIAYSRALFNNVDYSFQNQYVATGVNGNNTVNGYINKTITGSPYSSRGFVIDATTNVVLAQEDFPATTKDWNFSVFQGNIKIGAYDAHNQSYFSPALFPTTQVTVTPTPIAGAVYTLSTNTDYVNVSGTNTATIASLTDPSLADLKYIGAFVSDTPAGAQSNFYETGSTVHALSYTLVGGTWYGYDSADVDYNNAKAGLPNPLTLKWDTTSGDKTLHVTLQNSAGDYSYLTRTIHVGQGSQTLIQTRAQAMDGTNGGNLGMVSMQIYNHNSQTWTNLSPNDGLGSIITGPNTILSFYAQKAGFSDGTLLNQPARADLIYSVNLFTGPVVGSGFSNYFVTVKDAGGFPVGGASIKIINSTTNIVYKQATSSSTGGSQIFNLTASTLYTWTVAKNGYGTQSGSFTTPSSGGSGYLNVVLPSAVTPTKTPTAIPTGSWTVSPGYTYSGGNGTTFWAPWKNVFTMMGSSSTELPLLIAGLIIVLCMGAGAGMAGVLGAEVMMGFGAIFCVALGLIPIWVVLAIIILGFLFYGLKIGR